LSNEKSENQQHRTALAVWNILPHGRHALHDESLGSAFLFGG
jgi:hypothetical protein